MYVATFAHPGRNVEVLDIEPGSLVADFGSGSGHYALALAEAVGEEGRVYAIDVQSDLLRRLKNESQRHHGDTIETIVGNIEQLHGSRLKSALADMVLASNVLFQLEKPQNALAEARRILRSDGRLVIIDWMDSFRNLGPAKKHMYTKARAIHDATANGFAMTHEFAAGAHHYGLIFRTI